MCLNENVCARIGGTLTLLNKRIKRGGIKSYLIFQDPLGTGVSPCTAQCTCIPIMMPVRRKTPTWVGGRDIFIFGYKFKFHFILQHITRVRVGEGSMKN